MEKRLVYADNAATTRISDTVFAAMLPYLKESYGNPSSIYAKGREAKIAIETAREKIAALLGVKPREIFFTSGGTESDNWAIKGTAYAGAKKGKKHVITSAFEHHAVLHSVEALKEEGFDVTFVGVGSDGIIDPTGVEKAIRPDTALVSIMYANNEIGTVQSIAEIGKICRAYGVPFHTDAVQAAGNITLNPEADCVDMLTLSGHKIHAQKGVGLLYVRNGVKIPPFMHGGAQERDRRAGTENVPAIAGLAAALEEAVREQENRNEVVRKMSDRLIDGIIAIPGTRLNGDRVRRLPGNINISFEGIEGESLLLMLDLKGVAASSGSACTSGSLDPSHVLLAIGLPHEIAHGSLRISINEENTDADIDYILEVLPPIVERLRSMSPIWDK